MKTSEEPLNVPKHRHWFLDLIAEAAMAFDQMPRPKHTIHKNDADAFDADRRSLASDRTKIEGDIVASAKKHMSSPKKSNSK